MAILPRDTNEAHKGSVRRCWISTCQFHVMFTDMGWCHIDTHGEHVDHVAAPRHEVVGATHFEGFLFCGKEDPHGPHIHGDDEGNTYECEGVDGV